MKEKYPVMNEAAAEAFYFPGNEIGVLIGQGFTGMTQSMYYLGKQNCRSGIYRLRIETSRTWYTL